MNKFNVLRWNFNSDQLEQYDILPYFRDQYKTSKEKLKTIDDVKKFIERESRYQFWSRCEYEMICHGWPRIKNDYKIDIHDQVMMNIDIIAKILYTENPNMSD